VAAALIADCYAMLRMTEQGRITMPDAISREGYEDFGFFSFGVAQAIYTSVRSRGSWQRPGHAEIDDLLDQAFSSRSNTTVLGLTAKALAGIPASNDQPDGVEISCQSYQDGFEGPKPESVFKDGAVVLASPMCTRFNVKTASRGKDRWFWHLATDGYDRTPAKNRINGMEVKRRYLDRRGEAVSSARSGDVLTVELTVRSNKPIDNVAMVDLLPGGLEPILDPSARPEEIGDLIRFERREDRAVFFLRTSPDPKTYTYKVRAVTAGTYNIPSVTAEAMYKPEINAAFGGGTLEVTR